MGSGEPVHIRRLARALASRQFVKYHIMSAGLYITDVCITSYNFQINVIKSQKSPKMFMGLSTQTAICDIVYRFGNLTDLL